MLLKESSPRKRQGLALKLAVVLCGLGLLVNLNGPMDTNIGVTFSSNKEEKKVTAAAEVSPTAPTPRTKEPWPVYATSPMVPARLDFETLVAEDYSDIDSVYWHGVMGSVENEWYGTTAGSIVDVLIVQSNYPEGLEGVPVIVPARGAKWAFSEIYGRLAALQAAGAAPVIQAWLAGELPLTSFP